MSLGDQDNGQSAGQIGQILEKKRLEKGLSLKEVEQATKIRTRYLEGLEREDPTVLPDHIYARGFLKTYANFLGLDGERLSRELKDRRAPRRERQLDYQAYQAPNQELTRASEREQPLMTPGGVGGARRRRVSGGTILTVALAVLVLASVIGALYYVGSRSSGSGTADNGSEEPAVEQEKQDPNPPREERASGTTTGTKVDDAEDADEKSSSDAAEEKAAVSETSPVTVRVFNSPTGMTLLADGAVVYDGVAQPGFSQTFEARRTFNVSTRNGGAVEIEVDGQNLGRIGQPGQPVTRDFPVQPSG